MPTRTHTQESESQLPKTTEERFDKEMGITEGYELCITYEEQQDVNMEYEVKKFLAQELERVREETITQMTLNPDQRSEERARGLEEGLRRGREAGRTEALERIADEEGWEESREYYRKLLTPSDGADTKEKKE